MLLGTSTASAAARRKVTACLRTVDALIDDLPTEGDTWGREHFQRDALKRGLSELRGHDLFLLSDVDEIPTPDAIRSLPLAGVSVIDMSLHPFCVDWLHPEPWAGTVSCCGRDLKDISVLRYARDRPDFPHISGGRHFSWLGGEQATSEKLHSFSHDDLIGLIENFGLERYRKEGWHVNGTKLVPIDVDGTFPKWIQDRECPEIWFRP